MKLTVTAMEQKNHTTESVLGATPTRITNPFDRKLKERQRRGDAQAAVKCLKNNWLSSGRACERAVVYRNVRRSR